MIVLMIILSLLLILTLIKEPIITNHKNICKFKIQKPKYLLNGNKKIAIFNIIIEKKYRYFINFPLLFKFHSKHKFKSNVIIKYISNKEEQTILEKIIENNCDNIVYITDIIAGKICIEIILELQYGKPIIIFEILENNTCELDKTYKLELNFKY